MQIDIDHVGGLDLKKSAIVRLPDTSGLRIAVSSGAIWLTLDDDPRDIVLEPGDSFSTDEHRRGLIYALRPSSVALTAA